MCNSFNIDCWKKVNSLEFYVILKVEFYVIEFSAKLKVEFCVKSYSSLWERHAICNY